MLWKAVHLKIAVSVVRLRPWHHSLSMTYRSSVPQRDDVYSVFCTRLSASSGFEFIRHAPKRLGVENHNHSLVDAQDAVALPSLQPTIAPLARRTDDISQFALRQPHRGCRSRMVRIGVNVRR